MTLFSSAYTGLTRIQKMAGHWCLQHLAALEKGLWILAGLCLLAGLAALARWQSLAQRNAVMQHPAQVLAMKHPPHDAYWAYARGVALQNQPEQALQAFYLPEHSQDQALQLRSRFAMGNLYFDWAMSHHDVEHGGAHQQQVAMIALAREAYKEALRLQPGFAPARFNLELLDRRSPDKRTQGWQSETDGVTLKPFKRNGTAMMRDNRRRGLP